MSKKLTQVVANRQTDNQTVYPSMEYDDTMALQSMTALQNQEDMEQQAYETGNMANVYDGYSDMKNMYDTQETELPDVDVKVTEQQESAKDTKQFSNVFAKLFHTLASAFNKDSEIGTKLEEVAEQLDSTYGQDPYEVQSEALAENNMSTEQDITKSDSDVYVPTIEEQKERQEALDVSNGNMRRSAMLVASNDEFVSMANAKDKDFTHMTADIQVMGMRLSENAMEKLLPLDAGAKEKSEVANSYMTMMRGIKTYNDTALTEIETRYQDNPEKLEKAKQGLGNMMSRVGNEAYNIVGGANRQYDFLSEQDKIELDNLQLQGVDKTFSEYVNENHLEPDKQDDIHKYADVGITSGLDVGKVDTIGAGVASVNSINSNNSVIESRVALQGMKSVENGVAVNQDRVKMAESMFNTVLQKDAKQNQFSVDDGLDY